MEKYLQNKCAKKLYIVDLGSQNIGGSYKSIFNKPEWKYIGIDLEEGDNVDIVLENAYNWSEIESNSVDVLVSGQTFEHIEFFWITILEIQRILKQNGLCCLIAPSSGYEHRYPVDCWRFYPDGMKALAKFANLEVLEALTQWNDENYDDGSNVWHDTMLIAQKTAPLENESIEFSVSKLRCHEILTPKGQVKFYKKELFDCRSQLQEVLNKLNLLEVQHANMLETIEKSFFWKLRNQWFKIKNYFVSSK
ncbi:methyltransferase domain-containing protein [Synechocystis salina LEGE 00041]|nr:methyltransferase domain-containing protein [Synechocystis salina LEGE 00041]